MMRYLLRPLFLFAYTLLAVPAFAQAPQPVALVSLPFDLVGGLVVLRNLELNGQRGDFIVDTGCAYGLLVEQAAFAGQLRPLAARGLGATGTMAQQQLAVRSFQFGATHYAGLQAVAASLADVRRLVGPRLLGLIGTEILRAYEVVIDYQHRRLSCYPLSVGQGLARLPFVRADSLRFELVLGKPIAQGYVGQVPVQLLLDTGAMTNSLELSFTQQLAPAQRPRLSGTKEPYLGLGGQQQAQRATLPELILPPTAWRGLPMVLVRLAKPTKGRLPYQGILGFAFLSQNVVISFHYGRQQFYTLSPKHP